MPNSNNTQVYFYPAVWIADEITKKYPHFFLNTLVY